MRIKILGHTDAVGEEEDNLILSSERAKSVKEALVVKGIEASRIETEGMGESQAIADNSTEEGRALNRRTEFIILN